MKGRSKGSGAPASALAFSPLADGVCEGALATGFGGALSLLFDHLFSPRASSSTVPLPYITLTPNRRTFRCHRWFRSVIKRAE